MFVDEYSQQHQELLVDVDRTLKDLLDREDVDRNHQITIEDNGPKVSPATVNVWHRESDMQRSTSVWAHWRPQATALPKFAAIT